MKFKLFTFALLALLVGSCAPETPLPEPAKKGGEIVTISATIPTETRVFYTDSTLKLVWEYNDKILLAGYDGTTYLGSEIFTYSGTGNIFTGIAVPDATTYKAYYAVKSLSLDENGDMQLAANFWQQRQYGDNATSHIGRKLLLCDTIANALDQPFLLTSQSSIIKFALSNIPDTIGTIKKLIWTVQTKTEGDNRSAILDISNVNSGTTSLTAFLAFDPNVMKIAANGQVKIMLIGDKSLEWSTTIDYLKTYDAGKRYTAIVNSNWTTAAKTQFRYTITTKHPNTEYQIWQKSSSSINPANITIDWGDGSSNYIIDKDASLSKTIASHEYTIADDYTITIYSDQVDHTLIQTPQIIFFNSDTYDRDTLLTAILDPFPNMGKDFSFCFWGCIRLTSVPADLFRNNLLATSFYRCFLSCLQLASIPTELFKDNTRARDFTECFAGCQVLNSIPAELFKYNREAGYFSGCFSFCSGLTNIPENLFKYNTHITDFSNCFWHCTGLTSIPANLFMYNTKASLFYGCFWHCTGLTSIPANLFMYNTKATDFSYCFQNCTGLNSIPENLFRYNLEAQDFTSCFSGCSGLTKIPQILFIKNTKALWFNYCFQNCTGLTRVPVVLFGLNTQAKGFNSCFSGCTQLRLIAEIFPDPGTNPDFFAGRTMDFENCFYNVGTQAAYPGTAPRLWEFTGSSGWTVTNCFTNANVTNYGAIPPSWKGL